MIIVKDPAVAKSVTKSNNFETYSMAAQYRKLAQRTGINFDATIQLMDFLPVFIDGERHKDIRKNMARRIASSKSLQEKTANITVQLLLDKLFVAPNDIELTSQLARPLWREISASMVDSKSDMVALIDDAPSLFFPTVSIRERTKINQKLADFIDADRPNLQERLTHLGFAILGARPFVGSITLSIYEVVARNAGRNSNEISWPEIFPASSLRFVDRVCKDDVSVTNWKFDAGSRVRCYIHDASYSPEHNAASMFGYGMHTCLGKGIAEFSWRILVESLRRRDAILVPLDFQMGEDTEPFSMPTIARIGLRLAATAPAA